MQKGPAVWVTRHNQTEMCIAPVAVVLYVPLLGPLCFPHTHLEKRTYPQLEPDLIEVAVAMNYAVLYLG